MPSSCLCWSSRKSSSRSTLSCTLRSWQARPEKDSTLSGTTCREAIRRAAKPFMESSEDFNAAVATAQPIGWRCLHLRTWFHHHVVLMEPLLAHSQMPSPRAAGSFSSTLSTPLECWLLGSQSCSEHLRWDLIYYHMIRQTENKILSSSSSSACGRYFRMLLGQQYSKRDTTTVRLKNCA